jgi:hypothetical protein
MKNITSKSFIKNIVFDKKENHLLKKLNQCKTRKCSKINKEYIKENKIFTKEQNKKCRQKSDKAFYDCSDIFYENSKNKILFDKFIKCGEEKCAKEKKTLKKYREKLHINFI